jgi:hypothetical protein
MQTFNAGLMLNKADITLAAIDKGETGMAGLAALAGGSPPWPPALAP